MQKQGNNSMTTISKWISALGCALILAACGGGGGGSGPGNTAPTIRIHPDSTTLSAGHTMQVDVRLTHPDGTAATNGTSVSLSSNNAQRAQVAPASDPGAVGSQASEGTSGGRASFLVTGRSETGSVRLSASATFAGHTVSTNVDIEITDDGSGGGRLTIEGNNRLPANTTGVPIFFGSPYISELTITYRNASGQPASVEDGEIAVSIAPVTLAAYSTLDDPETEDINEFFVLMGGGPVNNAAGQSTIFVHSDDQPGTVTVTAEAQDASTGELFSTQFELVIEAGGADFLPAEILYDTGTSPLYTQGSGGASTKTMNIHVLDSGHGPVPDPDGFNNLRLELADPVPAGARLSGTNASGQSVSGRQIDVATVGGIAGFALNSGTEIGTARIIATADRADNNVDNDLQESLVEEASVEIGDGRLFSLRWDTPTVNAITVETISSDIDTDIECEEFGDTGVCIPNDPNGFYSLPVTVQGIDQAGNPVLSGTVSFGKIDAPLTPTVPRFFALSGSAGDPEEGGTLFTVVDPVDGFLDAPSGFDEAAGPGDTVALFGHEIEGNRQHEAVRTVDSVIDNTSLLANRAFNVNDDSGQSVDDGAVIPWVVGRAECGAVEQTASLGQNGMATVRLTYPMGCVSRPMVLWAQGNRPGGTVARTVADVRAGSMPGIAPIVLSATPNQVSGNGTVSILICLSDALGASIRDTFINAARIQGDGQASIDGVPIGSTTTASATGPDGCLTTELETSGMVPEGEDIIVRFSRSGAFDEVTVKPPGSAVLTATPSSITHASFTPITSTVALRLIDSSGAPISGVALSAECSDGGTGIVSGPGVTDENGETSASIQVDLASCDGGGTGSCTFATSTGSPSTTVNISGVDLSEGGGVSPAPTNCPDDDD